jgi:hypothetical protein
MQYQCKELLAMHQASQAIIRANLELLSCRLRAVILISACAEGAAGNSTDLRA